MNTSIIKLGMFCLVMLCLSAWAINPPAGFQGAITLDGAPAPENATLIAWIPGSTADASCPIVSAGEYGPVQLAADDPATSDKEGGVQGDGVRFKLLVGDSVFNAEPVCIWKSGETQTVNLQVWRNRAAIWSATHEIEFNTVALRSQSEAGFSIVNAGNADLLIQEVVSVNNDIDVLFEDSLLVAKDSAKVIQVLFRPETEDEFNDQIRVSSNAGEWIITVHGRGYELWPLHWRVTADTTDWLGSSDSVGSLAYNQMTHHLALAGPGLSFVHPGTGRLLQQRIVPSENLHRVAISADGQIFACTLAMNGAEFKLYRYSDESAEPDLAFQGLLPERVGDALAVSGVGTELKVYVSGLGNSKIFIFTTTDGAVYENSGEIVLPEAGTAGYSICSVPETDYLFVAGPAKSARYIKNDGTPIYSFGTETISAANLSYFERMDGNGHLRRFLAFINGAAPGTKVAELLGPGPASLCDSVYVWPAATPEYQQFPNLNATAQVMYNGVENTLIELVTNNGLSSYHFNQILHDPMPCSGYLVGRVTNCSDASPLANAEIRILGLDWITITDDDGCYAFLDVPCQEYQVRVNAMNFFSQTKTVFVTDQLLATADFSLKQREYLPISVTACPSGPDVLLQWDLSRPQTRLFSHNEKPTSGWFQKMNMAYGVVFDLSPYVDATLEQVDFNHFSWQLLHGPYRYRVHIYNMLDSTQVAEMDGLTSQDSWASAQWETAVDLSSLSGLEKVGIFIEPLSGTVNDAHPIISTDNQVPCQPGVNYIIEDVSAPFATLMEAREKNDGYGNFLIDLWINHQGIRRQLIAGSAATPAAWSGTTEPTRRTITAAQINPKPQPPMPQSLYGFRIYRNLTDSQSTLQLLATTPPNSFSFVDIDMAQDTSCVYGVSALYDSVESAIVSVPYYHPPVLTISQAREDDNSDGLLDRIGQLVTVSGVTTTQNFASRSLSDFYMQEENTGVHITCASHALDVQPGMQIYISGRVTNEDGLAAIAITQPASLQVVKKDVPVLERLITYGQLADSLESRLVRVEGYILVNQADWPIAGQDGWLDITNGADTVTVFIDHNTDMDGTEAFSGIFNLVGILDYTAAHGYALRPRQRADFSVVSSVAQTSSAPERYELRQNYPNPFNPATTIMFTLPQSEPVRITVVDLSGRETAVLQDGPLSAGSHKFSFSGRGLASGVYFYQVETPTFRDCKKMILMK